MLTITTGAPRASLSRRRVIARVWHPATTLAELKEAQYKRVVVPVEGEGKILVQELDGAQLRLRQHSRATPAYSIQSYSSVSVGGVYSQASHPRKFQLEWDCITVLNHTPYTPAKNFGTMSD